MRAGQSELCVGRTAAQPHSSAPLCATDSTLRFWGSVCAGKSPPATPLPTIHPTTLSFLRNVCFCSAVSFFLVDFFKKSSYLLWNKKAAERFVLYSTHTRPVANTKPIDHNRIVNSHIYCFLSNTVKRWSFAWTRCFHSTVQTAVFGLRAILGLLVERFVCYKSRIWCFYNTESIKKN